MESLFGDFVSGWLCMKHPCGAAAEAITGTERRGEAAGTSHFPEKDSLLKDVLDLN